MNKTHVNMAKDVPCDKSLYFIITRFNILTKISELRICQYKKIIAMILQSMSNLKLFVVWSDIQAKDVRTNEYMKLSDKT